MQVLEIFHFWGWGQVDGEGQLGLEIVPSNCIVIDDVYYQYQVDQ